MKGFNRDRQLKKLISEHERLITRPNPVDERWYNGVYERFAHPVITREHTPLFWRYDLDPASNPLLLERQGVDGTYNAGAIEFEGKICLVVRVEGYDRKSFFAVAESPNGVDNFRFWDHPVTMPETDDPDTNVYDMRLTKHEDGWIYGLFCTERKDPKAPASDTSSAVAQCGICRTKDLVKWERLPDLVSRSPQQRNVVLHPEFIGGKYGLYTRPMDEFITTGAGGGIGWALCDSMEKAVIGDEKIIDPKVYHTIKEVKNGQGPAPFKTPKGWLHILHGVRNTAAAMRYTIYAYLTDLKDPSKVVARPAGHLIAPLGWERVGDVSNVLFTNGAVLRDDGTFLLYYASSDTRMHVARSTIDRMLDYVLNTPEDGLRSAENVRTRNRLIDKNLAYLKSSPAPAIKKTGN